MARTTSLYINDEEENVLKSSGVGAKEIFKLGIIKYLESDSLPNEVAAKAYLDFVFIAINKMQQALKAYGDLNV